MPVVVGFVAVVMLGIALVMFRRRPVRLPRQAVHRNFDHSNPNASVWDNNVQVDLALEKTAAQAADDDDDVRVEPEEADFLKIGDKKRRVEMQAAAGAGSAGAGAGAGAANDRDDDATSPMIV